ncbi:hypothetical protein AKJ09_10542 [Labilithrix luteola]|uniref:PEGA domain-containing protein n=1 Tax=Labilithrix luteola TaxID=1391654 RepID=A0A0K1QDP0_9BACT|nr:hypothetical protein [Labilithrix luteola]AKV03879.1 hypothetical protein AKJ09_10542 [Labilithrix luteola]
MKRTSLVIAAFLAFGISGSAHADTDSGTNAEAAVDTERDPARLFEASVDALAKGHAATAIAGFESLGDHGVVDPVVSYDRGLAYAARVRAGAEQPGDLGRATHGFEEARDLTKDSALAADASRALTDIRAEIARRRARAGDPVEFEHGASFGRSIVTLLDENVWAVLAGIFAAALAVGIVLRARATAPRAKVAGNTTAAVAGGLLLVTSLVLYFARDARLHLREGVVVIEGAHLLDDRHVALGGVAPIPEGARVRILDDGIDFTRVVVSETKGYLPSNAVLPLAKR